MAIYLDNQATTPLDPRVWQVMVPLFRDQFGNPGAVDSPRGRAARDRVEQARAQIAAAVGAEAREIVFTSGATEANNLALKGVMRLQAQKGRPRLVTFATEHKCVLEAAKHLDADILPVQRDGLVDLNILEQALDDRVGLVSLMAVHNEIGLIQNLAAIGEMVARCGALFHCDMAQALGKIPIDLASLPISLASFSAHKAYGPMGVGALYLRRKPRARITPLFHGGGQERGVRSGTLPLPLIAGFGEAARLATEELEADLTRAWAYREQILALPHIHLNGHREQRVPSNLNLILPEGVSLDGFDYSRGSACSAEDLEPSYVLTALGLKKEAAARSVRLSFGRFTTQAEVEALKQALCTIKEA